MEPDNDGQRVSPTAGEARQFAEIAERVGRSIATGFVIGTFFIALAIYERPGPPRFQAFAAGTEIVRLDTREGNLIACEGGQCINVRHPGQDLAKALPQPGALQNSVAPNPGH